MLLLLLALALAQTPSTPTDCAGALARSTSTVTAQICLGEEQLAAARPLPKGSAEWRRRLEAAVPFYQRALALTADEVIKTAVIERLLALFDEPLLNDPRAMEGTLREFIALKPTELDPLFRFAKFQEAHGSPDAAEETLLSARRLRPGEIDPLKMLAQFYARRASALYSQDLKNKPPETPTVPGEPDRNGVYRVGQSLTPPRRTGNPTYPPEAQAAGIAGTVVAEITVDETGTVVDARVLTSIPMLDDAALKAVREWRYDPTIVNGKAVPVKMNVTVNFTLRR